MSKEQVAAATAQQAGTPAIDWPALDRQARRVAVAKAPLAAVQVAFMSFKSESRQNEMVTATWRGQVYGSLAVVQIGTPLIHEQPASLTGYQLIHVPTGLYLRSHKRAHSLRVLALALNATGVDWSFTNPRGLAEVASEQREAVDGIIREWGDTYVR